MHRDRELDREVRQLWSSQPGARVLCGHPPLRAVPHPLPWIAEVGDQEFAGVVEQAPLPVLLDLWAPWCGPCHLVSPALEELARTFAGRIKLVKVNIDTAPQTAQRFTVRAVPTLMVLDRGRVVARQAGAAPAPVLRSWLEAALSEVGNQPSGSRA